MTPPGKRKGMSPDTKLSKPLQLYDPKQYMKTSFPNEVFFCLKKQGFQRQTHTYNTQVGLTSILETS